MPDRLIIKGGKKLKGEINVRGSKNAATPMIAATLLAEEKPCRITNLPLIADVHKMIRLIESVGAEVEWEGERSITVDATDLNPESLDQKLVAQMRSSILTMGPLLARFGKLSIRHPGGCLIGARPIDTHLNGLKDLGVKVEVEEFGASQASDIAETKKAHMYHLEAGDLKGKEIILDEFSVTGTENMLMAASLAEGETTLKIAAAEPHVQNLADFLNKMGADIRTAGTNAYRIKGKKKLKGADHKVIPDYLEAGTFIILGLAAQGEITVKNVPADHLELILSKLKKFGGDIEFIDDGVVKVGNGGRLEIPGLQAMPYPGIPTDLQSPLGVLATQAEGLTLIHDPMYEGRLKYLEELNKMGAEIVMCDPHRAIINGPTELYGTKLDPLDLRSGAALIIAGIIADGTTIIKDVSQADRGYEEIEKRLQKLGVDVKRIKE